MKRIINYINRKQRIGLELKLKMQYTDIMGWNIKIHIKGYDMPLIEAEDMDLDNAINKTHEMLRKVEFDG